MILRLFAALAGLLQIFGFRFQNHYAPTALLNLSQVSVGEMNSPFEALGKITSDVFPICIVGEGRKSASVLHDHTSRGRRFLGECRGSSQYRSNDENSFHARMLHLLTEKCKTKILRK